MRGLGPSNGAQYRGSGRMRLQEDYQVRLDAFCGPLDLLLYLIRRAEVDVCDISIAEITDQYLRFLREVDDIDIEAAGDFLVMAATLMEMKSRTLMPAGIAADDQDEGVAQAIEIAPGEGVDPRFELVQQLLQYQRFRTGSETLELHRREFERRFPVRCREGEPAAEPQEPPDLELEDAHVFDLFESYERVRAAIDFDRMGDHRIELDDTPAVVYRQNLLDLLAEAGGRLALQDAFADLPRVRRLGLFLAMLELVRLRRVKVRQEDLLAEINVELLHEDEGGDSTAHPKADRGDAE